MNLEVIRDILQALIIPVLAWLIAIERRLSKLEGRCDMMVRILNGRSEKD